MKKLFTISFLLLSIAAFAQKDVAVTLHSPVNGDTIRQTASFNLNFTVTNVGTEAITNTDTVIVIFTIDTNILYSSIGIPVFKMITTGLAVGDSVVTSYNVTTKFPVALSTQICALAVLDADTTMDNNVSCADVVLTYNTGLNELAAAATSVKVYPNPASTIVNFSIDYSKAEQVSVYDVTGKLVNTSAFQFNQAQVDVASMKAGIYMYQITDVNGHVIKAGKFNVQ